MSGCDPTATRSKPTEQRAGDDQGEPGRLAHPPPPPPVTVWAGKPSPPHRPVCVRSQETGSPPTRAPGRRPSIPRPVRRSGASSGATSGTWHAPRRKPHGRPVRGGTSSPWNGPACCGPSPTPSRSARKNPDVLEGQAKVRFLAHPDAEIHLPMPGTSPVTRASGNSHSVPGPLRPQQPARRCPTRRTAPPAPCPALTSQTCSCPATRREPRPEVPTPARGRATPTGGCSRVPWPRSPE
jgi:hypothetical protein